MNITEDMIKNISSPVIYKRGLEYFREGRVHIRSINETSVTAVADGTEIYNVSINVQDSKIKEFFCTCPYYHTMGCSCKHIIATLKMCQKELENISSGDNANDTIAALLCKEYQKQSIEKTKLSIGFRLNIYTNLDRCGFSVSLKIGEKSEIISNISSFINNMYYNGFINFSKHKKLSLSEYSFGELESSVLDILNEVQEIRHPNNASREEIPISQYTMKRILPILKNIDCEYKIDGALYPDLRIVNDNPDILVDINAMSNKINMIINERGTALTSDGALFLYEGIIFETSKEWRNWFMPIYNTIIKSKRTQIDFTQNNAVDFITTVLPGIKEKQGVILNGFDEVVVNEKPEFEVYISKFKNGLSVTPIVHYGSITLIPCQNMNLNEKILIRNIRLENEVISFFEDFEQVNERFITLDDEILFDFLSVRLPKLETYATIIYNEKFTINTDIPLTVKAGYLKDINLFEVGFESTLSDSEVSGILNAVALRKNFYRNSDGNFYKLDFSEFSLSDLVISLGFDMEDIKNGKKNISGHNAFYLSGLKQKGLISSTKEFDEFIEKINNTKITIPPDIDKVLREYQRDGVKWLAQLSTYGFGGILADDMGLGKTLQVIAFTMSIKRDKPVLVVAPSSLTYNWQNEIMKFAPNARSIIIEGQKNERSELLKDISEYDFVITSYPLMRRDMELYTKKEFAYFFIDEAQYIKNPGTINAKSVKKIKAGGYFALTGTPIENSLSELWSIFDFVMKGYLYSYRDFTKRFQNGIMKEEDQSKIEELRRKIQPFILRRMKKEVLKELPEKIENTVYTGLEPEQKRMYEAFLKVARNEIMYMSDFSGENNMRILTLLMRLRQICCHPKLFDSNFKDESGKLLLFEELVTSAIEAGHRILVFSQFTSMLGIIKERLEKLEISYFYLDGSTHSEERIELANKFNNGEREIFLISLKAGGTGLNLTGADMVIHYDPWWNPAVMDQASDRAYRIGQKKAVQVIKLAAKGTIEEQIIKLQDKKKELADNIIKENSKLLSGLSKDEILSIFS